MNEIEKIREQFPVTRQLVYLNHAAVSPLPVSAVEAVGGYCEDIQNYGCLHESRWFKEIEKTREKFSALINAQSSEIAFLKSPFSGIKKASYGIGLKEGDKVVTADVEFPANVYPWMSMVPKGVEVKFVGAKGGRIEPGDVEKAVDAKTRVVAISLVEFGSGFRNHIEEISEFCRRKGVRFFLDASQGVGAIPFDVKESGADFLMSGTYKWLMGPQSMGMFYCRSELLEEMKLDGVSWRSLAQEGDMSGVRIEQGRDARLFESEQPNFMGILGLNGSLLLREKVGNSLIFSRIKLLVDRLIEGLQGKEGYILKTPLAIGERSGIVAFGHETLDGRDITTKLKKAGIIVAIRNNVIRVSPHFYNSEEEVDFLLAELP